jgi:Di-haem oxidoreductase, putative peroxidase/Animal haem peroxidase
VTEPTESPNTRDPRYDLDSVYGDGPLANPELYQPVPRGSRGRPTKLRIESGGLFEDVPRDSSGTAIIADPRNDENMMISGLQAAVILFHNHAVDVLKDEDRGLDSEELFEKARRLTTWHYQWMIVHEFLPLFIGQKLVDDIFNNGRKFFRPDKPFIPVEFQGATYRFGHSMVRPSYRANLAGDNDPASPGGLAFFGMIFVPDTDPRVHTSDPIDLRGGARARRRFIGWQTFFDFGPTFTDPGSTNPAIRRNKKIDSLISSPLFELPVGTIAGAPPNEAIISLPQRNLLRHITWSLPSGQDIARFIRVPQLSTADTGLSSFGLGLDEDTPLWYYALKEAELMTGGISLGPVGGRIVGEVFAGLLKLDQDSYLNARDRWKPTLPQRNGRVTGDFKMIDFLTFAGVAPDQRGQWSIELTLDHCALLGFRGFLGDPGARLCVRKTYLTVPSAVGCAHCHTPKLQTNPKSTTAALSGKDANLFSDLALHNMGRGLADDIIQGLAQGNEFRTAPLWGLGQRIFFLHDGRSTDLLDAMQEHKSEGSEANKVIDNFDRLDEREKQDVLNFLRSL